MNTPLLAGIPDSNVITYMTHGRPISDNDNNYYIIAHRESEVSFSVSFVCIVKVKTKIKANTMICLCRVECKYETWKHKNALSISIVWTVFARFFVAVLVAVIFNTWAKKKQRVHKSFHKYSPFSVRSQQQQKFQNQLNNSWNCGLGHTWVRLHFSTSIIIDCTLKEVCR